MDDLISRQAALDVLEWFDQTDPLGHTPAQIVRALPAAEPIIRCRECKWWDDKGHGIGYCHAAKHGYWSEHWEISIKRTYEGNFFCADAERRNDAGE